MQSNAEPGLVERGLAEPGLAERGLAEHGRRSAAVAHVVVVLVCGLLAPTEVAQGHVVATAGVAAALIGWNVVYGAMLVRRDRRWLVPADAVVVCAVCLSQPWTVPVEALSAGAGWVLFVAGVTVVTYQWHTGPVTGAVVTMLVVAAYNVGCAASAFAAWLDSLHVGIWLLAQALLSRGLFMLVRRGGLRADAIRARGERMRREAAVAAARRADTREYLAAVHDTAAATLLVVGLGMVAGRERWLSDQAGRDLEVLVGQADVAVDEVDLIEMLRSLDRYSRLRIDWIVESPLLAPHVPAVALYRSVREALTNVERHAGVGTAAVGARRDRDRIVIEVIDAGRGFEPERAPAHRRGLSHSVSERMVRVGGSASVASHPGRGTVVRLEWPSG